MDGALEILLQQLVDGQTQTNTRLGVIEKYMAEKKGERKAVLWVFTAASGAMGSLVSVIATKLMHKGP